MGSQLEVVDICNLVLSNGFILRLEKTFYVPSFFKNLISISRLVPLGFYFNFLDSGFTLTNKSKIVGFSELCDDLYSIKLQNNIAYNSMHVLTRLK